MCTVSAKPKLSFCSMVGQLNSNLWSHLGYCNLDKTGVTPYVFVSTRPSVCERSTRCECTRGNKIYTKISFFSLYFQPTAFQQCILTILLHVVHIDVLGHEHLGLATSYLPHCVNGSWKCSLTNTMTIESMFKCTLLLIRLII